MAFEVAKVYKEHFPALRVIGTRYTNDDRNEGGFDRQWKEWMDDDRVEKMKKAVGVSPYSEDTLGLMTMKEDTSAFTYWIGLFFPEGTNVPPGFDHLDLPESDIGTGWVRGSNENDEIFGAAPHEAVIKELEKLGIGNLRNDIAGEGSETYCFFERYNVSRFMEKDANGNIVLDYGNYIKA